ncbi:hypothetical protein [Azospirillum thermophilum]|uniref:HPr kinase/phosphorylase C-terminal domain-containing protein n=1 Tax=Azospirillum thermophilum TaxID=2202148 RepID=A0A2S2CV52_9PROT|nr:hypothetical protein [Azospirillum thermophilum]AWK88356.1 hypothetical protein DEW08_19910 [Azospirillum thermophilum]
MPTLSRPAPGLLPSTDDRMLCGWRVASALRLPDLLPWTGDGRAPDLVIDLGPVPDRLDDPVIDHALLQVAADGACRFAIPDVAAFLIDPAGRHVTVDPALPPETPDIRVFLLGTVFGILCYRRGLLPLHASCVRVGDGAVALAGPSGIGKSTLAAALVRQGHAMLADDVTVLDVVGPGGPRVLPAFPRLKLWRDALARMGRNADGLERSRAELDKFHLPVTDAFCPEPLPLRAVFHLEAARHGDGDGLRRLRGPEAVARMGRDLYRGGLMMRLGLTGRALPAMVTAAGARDGTWAVAHGHGPGGLDRSIAGILDRLPT